MKQFIKKLIILISNSLILICAINYLYISHLTNFGTMGPHKNDKAYVVDVPSDIEICNFGNSHGYYAFNYEEYEKRYTCFNFSLPSQSMSYNLRILENYKDNIAPGAKVYICLSFQSFFCNTETTMIDFESKNKRYYHFLNKDYIKNYDLKTDIFVNYLPSLSDSNINSLVKITLGINSDYNEDYWAESTNKDKANEHAVSRVKVLISYTVDNQGNRKFNGEEIESLYEMINLCNELQAEPILITTPYLSEYTNLILENDPKLLEDFYKIVADVQQKTGVEYIDYSVDSRFSKDYDLFFNTDHMNRVGAKKFTKILLSDTLVN